MNSTFLVRYWDVLVLTSVTDVYMNTPEVQSQQEQGDDDEDDDDFCSLHCHCSELLNIHIIREVKTKSQPFVYIAKGMKSFEGTSLCY